MSNDTAKPTDSTMIVQQKQLIERMKRDVLPPGEGPHVGAMTLPVVREGESWPQSDNVPPRPPLEKQ